MKIRLSSSVRLRADPRDGVTVLLSPERGLRLGTTAAEIVALCDGSRHAAEIVDALHARYGGDRARIDRDVRSLLADLRGRGLLEGFDADTPPPAAPPPAMRDEAGAPPPSAETVEAPYTLVAELTHRCPLACPYCSNPRDLVPRHEELGTEEWLRAIDDAADLGVMQVHLTGGEPLARNDLELIAARARARDLYVSLVTSGVPLERSRLERLRPSLDHVQLSVQDADPARADRISDFPGFAAKMAVASWVKELGLPLTLNVVLHRHNLDHLEAIISLAERLGAERLELANVQLVTWALANAAALLPTRPQVDRARVVAEAARRRLEGRMAIILVLPDWHADRPRACMDGWARRFVVVAPDGMVLPCHAARTLPLRFDGLRSASLRTLWRDGEGLRAFRGQAWMREPCASCERRGIDHGGCRCQAFALTGDARATDPACALAPAHDLVVRARSAALSSPPSPDAAGRIWLYRGR